MSSRLNVEFSHCPINLIAVRQAGLPAFLINASGSRANNVGNRGTIATGSVMASDDISLLLSLFELSVLLAWSHKIAAKICLQQPDAEQSQLAC